MASPAEKSSAPPPKKRRKRAHIHKRRTGHVGAGGVRSEINVTPLVDVVLVLLIIFMVITPMLQRGKAVTLPDAKLVSELKSGGDPIIIAQVEPNSFWPVYVNAMCDAATRVFRMADELDRRICEGSAK